ncbi:MAG: diol dehydratase small subunit [Candidatus Brachytrichaceae bacterium NZ_4S206]|jgi:propanediol dehydratase small subunit
MKDERLTDDFQISSATLRRQADAAQAAGFTQLAENLRRAAELTAVPKEELLRIYEALRPGRSTEAELLTIADALARDYSAQRTAAFIREAAAEYARRQLFRPE